MRLKLIKEQAIILHKDQKYGIYPYEIHLFNVANVLLRYLFPEKDNFNLFAGAWLHDVLEDTDITKEKFIEYFGAELFEIVWCLTDGKGGDYSEQKEEMYKKLINNQNSIIIKLADRIANIEFSLINSDKKKLSKYIQQNERLNQVLSNNVKTKVGIKLLERLNFLISIILEESIE